MNSSKIKYIIDIYEERLALLNIKFKKQSLSKAEVGKVYQELHNFYLDILDNLFTQEDFYNEDNCIFNYRGLTLDVKVDDYGQQFYLEYEGKFISGGAFNIYFWLDFISQLDIILDYKVIYEED